MASFDVDELYDIAKRLKTSADEIKTTKAVLSKNPSSAMHRRETEAVVAYDNALKDFGVFIEKAHYIDALKDFGTLIEKIRQENGNSD